MWRGVKRDVKRNRGIYGRRADRGQAGEEFAEGFAFYLAVNGDTVAV